MINKVKRFIPSVFKQLYKDVMGYSFIRNYFLTDSKKRVLISYINKPFFIKQNFVHTNFHEALAIADVFRSLDYQVDLIEYTKFKAFEPESYEVIFGLGESVEFALKEKIGKKKYPFVIWHGTGSNPFFSNPLTIKRLDYVYKRFGLLLPESTRFLYKVYPLSYVFSDLIILYGNQFTKSTYLDHTYSPIELINPTSYFNSYRLDRKFFTKENYIWFGSAGAIHKGLDILLDFFEKRSDLTLHICGELKSEKRFFNAYRRQLHELSNIKYHGFVDVKSDIFKNLMETCTFTILPSCSEGTATSVITTMANGGLIPIVTRNAGIDISDYGIFINEITLAGVTDAIDRSQKLTHKEIQNRSNQILCVAQECYTIENFSRNLKSILIKYLNK